MAYSIDVIEDGILDYLRGILEPAYDLHDDYIPNTATLKRRASGEVENYYVIQFGDLQPQSGYAMTGARDDDYGMPIYLQAISASAHTARKMARYAESVFLGANFPWAGQIRKKPGFNQLTIDTSTGAVEAYAYPLFYSLLVQVSDNA